MSQQHQLAAQAAQVLEQIESLTAVYRDTMDAARPELASSLQQCAEELTRYLETVKPVRVITPAPAPPSRSPKPDNSRRTR